MPLLPPRINLALFAPNMDFTQNLGLSREIIALAFSIGKRHDFQLFKDSCVHVKAETVLEADTGYQGLALIHANSLLKSEAKRS